MGEYLMKIKKREKEKKNSKLKKNKFSKPKLKNFLFLWFFTYIIIKTERKRAILLLF